MIAIVTRNLNLNYYCNKGLSLQHQVNQFVSVYTALIKSISDEHKTLTKNSRTVSQDNSPPTSHWLRQQTYAQLRNEKPAFLPLQI